MAPFFELFDLAGRIFLRRDKLEQLRQNRWKNTNIIFSIKTGPFGDSHGKPLFRIVLQSCKILSRNDNFFGICPNAKDREIHDSLPQLLNFLPLVDFSCQVSPGMISQPLAIHPFQDLFQTSPVHEPFFMISFKGVNGKHLFLKQQKHHQILDHKMSQDDLKLVPKTWLKKLLS